MDTPSNGGRDSRYNLNNYEMPILTNDSSSEMYNSNILHNRPTSITSNLSRSSNMNNSCQSGIQRGLKRTSDMCYDPSMSSRSNMISSDCSSDIIEDTYSPSHQKNSPLSNGKKTKGRVKIKMEYIDNKLRRYTTFSKRKTGIMKKAYELSTLTGTQVMLLVASETGHVYTFATRKLQPMITSETGKALIQTCLNSPDPCPSGSADQRMSATGFEETELSYNIGDDDKVDVTLCSPYKSENGSDSSDVESVSSSPTSSPPPLISLQDFQASSSTSSSSSSSAVAAAAAAASAVTAVTKGPNNKIRCVPLNSLKQEIAQQSGGPSTEDRSKPKSERSRNRTSNGNNTAKSGPSSSNTSSSSTLSVSVAPTSASGSNSVETLSKNGNNAGGLVFTLEQLQREFGLHVSSETGTLPQYITIPMLSGITNASTNPPAAHQTPADLSNRSRK